LETTGDTDQLSHEALRIEADDAYRNDDYSAAIRLYSSALECLERTAPKDRKSKIRILTWLALSYQMEKDYASARQYHEAELRLARQLRDPEKTADALHRLGDTFIELRDYRRAERCLSESLKHIRRFGSNRKEIPHLLFDLGEIAERRNQPRNASARFREWIHFKQERRETDLPYGWYRLGIIAVGQKDWKNAEDHFYTTLVVAHDVGSALWECYALYGLGRLAKDCANYDRSEHLLTEALRIAKSLNATGLTGSILLILGNIASDRADYATATRFFIQSIATGNAMDDPCGTIRGMKRLCVTYVRRKLFGFSALAFGLVDAFSERHGIEETAAFAETDRERCRKSVSEETWERAQEKARTMSVTDALDYFSEE
jgi:tetratricopeptide (TPR) repeat protein